MVRSLSNGLDNAVQSQDGDDQDVGAVEETAYMRAMSYCDTRALLTSLTATIVGFLVLSYIGTTMKHRYEEKIQAEELASVALKRLRDQVSTTTTLVVLGRVGE